jgi:hypothetical protein
MSDAERENQLPTDIGNIPFNNAVENLKTQYDFVQVNEISTFLKSYPSLIDDLNKVYETKSQYFGKAPMALRYTSETGSLESVTLAAYIKTDLPEQRAEEVFSKFDEEWWNNISEDAKLFVTVDLD